MPNISVYSFSLNSFERHSNQETPLASFVEAGLLAPLGLGFMGVLEVLHIDAYALATLCLLFKVDFEADLTDEVLCPG